MIATIIFIALLFIDLVINCERHGEPRKRYNLEFLNYYNGFVSLVQFCIFMCLLYYMGSFEKFI